MDINQTRLIELDRYICTTNGHNLSLTELTILLSLHDSPKDYQQLADSIGRSVSSVESHMPKLRLTTARKPRNLGFVHTVQGKVLHLTMAGRAWIDGLSG